MAPDWVSIDLAAFLTGLDAGAIDQAITLAGVEAMERDGKLLIDRDSLRDFWEMVHAVGADGRLSDDP